MGEASAAILFGDPFAVLTRIVHSAARRTGAAAAARYNRNAWLHGIQEQGHSRTTPGLVPALPLGSADLRSKAIDARSIRGPLRPYAVPLTDLA